MKSAVSRMALADSRLRGPRASRRFSGSRRSKLAEELEGAEEVRQEVEGELADATARVDEVCAQVGLTAELRGRRPHEVSDGQLQRACLARALAPRPDYLLCDEMTAMLDASSTAALVSVVAAEVDGRGLGVLAVSHDEALLAAWAGRVLRPWS